MLEFSYKTLIEVESNNEKVCTLYIFIFCLLNDLKWNILISNIFGKASKRIYRIRACRKANLPTEIGLCIYEINIRPLHDYACSIWGGVPQYLEDELQRVQDRCMNIIGVPKNTLESQRRDKQTRKNL